MVLKINNDYDSEAELCLKIINFYNIIDGWGLTDTMMNILVYVVRFGWNTKTKDIIKDKLKLTENSITTNISYMRRGRVGNKDIKKLLDISSSNRNVTVLRKELKDIKKLVESPESFKALYVKFDPIK